MEALASSAACTALVHVGEEHARVKVRAAKPHALRPVAAAAEVEATAEVEADMVETSEDDSS